MVGNETGLYARFRGAVQSWLSRDKTSEYREMALLRSLPRWKGFSVDGEEIEEMTATAAIEKLGSVIYCLSHVVIEGGYGFYQTIEFPIQKVRVSAQSNVVLFSIVFFLWKPWLEFAGVFRGGRCGEVCVPRYPPSFQTGNIVFSFTVC